MQSKWQQQQQKQQQQLRRRQMMYQWDQQQRRKKSMLTKGSCSICGQRAVQICTYCRKPFCSLHLIRLTRNSHLRNVGHNCYSQKPITRISPSSLLSKTKSAAKPKLINPFVIGAGFLNYCIKMGWLIQEGKGQNARYYLTKQGEEEIRNQFDIKV